MRLRLRRVMRDVRLVEIHPRRRLLLPLSRDPSEPRDGVRVREIPHGGMVRASVRAVRPRVRRRRRRDHPRVHPRGHRAHPQPRHPRHPRGSRAPRVASNPRQAQSRRAHHRAVEFRDGRLGAAPLLELHEAAPLPGRNLHVHQGACRFKALAEVRLVHGGVEAADEHRRALRRLDGILPRSRGNGLAGYRLRDAHRARPAPNAVHLRQRLIALILLRETDKSETLASTGGRIGDDARVAHGRVPRGEGLLQVKVAHLGREVADEDGMIDDAGVGTRACRAVVRARADAESGPVQSEVLVRRGHGRAVERAERALGRRAIDEFGETVPLRVPRRLVSDDLHVRHLTCASSNRAGGRGRGRQRRRRTATGERPGCIVRRRFASFRVLGDASSATSSLVKAVSLSGGSLDACSFFLVV